MEACRTAGEARMASVSDWAALWYYLVMLWYRVMRVLMLSFFAAVIGLAQNVTVEFDPAANFAGYRTFTIRDGQLNSKNPALNSELVKKRIEAAIARDLSAKALTMVPDKGDLNVRYHFGSARKTQVERYPAGWRGMGTRVVKVPHTEGTLVLDLRDSQSRSLVWRGIARQDKSDANKLQEKLDDMVRKAFDKYPPKQK
jgi:hypothetical protein